MEVTKETKVTENEVVKIVKERAEKEVITFVLDKGQANQIADALFDICWAETKNGTLLHGLYQSFLYGGEEALKKFLGAKDEADSDTKVAPIPTEAKEEERKHKFAVGDKVRVKRGLVVEKAYNSSCFFVEGMRKYIGREFTIKSVNVFTANPRESRYLLNGIVFNWSDDMLESADEPCRFKVGDKVTIKRNPEALSWLVITAGMKQYLGRKSTIATIVNKGGEKEYYTIKLDGGAWYWHESFFE